VSMPDREAVEIFPPGSFRAPCIFAGSMSACFKKLSRAGDLERLYIAAHTLGGTSASYGFPRFSDCWQARPRFSIRVERHPRGRFARSAYRIPLRRNLRTRNRPAGISDTGQESSEISPRSKNVYRFAFPAEPSPLNYGQQRITEQASRSMPRKPRKKPPPLVLRHSADRR